MERAMSETARRREKQHQHNLDNNITPQGLNKNVKDIMEGARVPGKKTKKGAKANKVGEQIADYLTMTPSQLAKEFKRLETKMHEHAKNLEFEEAAATRDKLAELKQHSFLS